MRRPDRLELSLIVGLAVVGVAVVALRGLPASYMTKRLAGRVDPRCSATLVRRAVARQYDRGEILERTLWVEPGKVTMQVVDGAVMLAGEVESEADAELLPVLVARVPGVVSVRASLQARATAVR